MDKVVSHQILLLAVVAIFIRPAVAQEGFNVNNTVHHSRDYPSQIRLPVVKK